MISDGEKWHYLTVRSLSAFLKGITSEHKGDSYCLNCFHSHRTKEALEKHMKVCEDKDYCYIEMPKKGETLEHHPGVKSMKAPYIIVADIESLLRKVDTCANDTCSLFTDCSFYKKYNKLDYYRGKDSLKRFCQDLKKQARSITDFGKKEMNELTDNEKFNHYIEDKCHICNKPFYQDKKNNYIKVREIIVIIQENIEVPHIKYVILCIIIQEKYQLYFIMEVVMIIILS